MLCTMVEPTASSCRTSSRRPLFNSINFALPPETPEHGAMGNGLSCRSILTPTARIPPSCGVVDLDLPLPRPTGRAAAECGPRGRITPRETKGRGLCDACGDYAEHVRATPNSRAGCVLQHELRAPGSSMTDGTSQTAFLQRAEAQDRQPRSHVGHVSNERLLVDRPDIPNVSQYGPERGHGSHQRHRHKLGISAT